jgi:uncharacterized protein YvpB
MRTNPQQELGPRIRLARRIARATAAVAAAALFTVGTSITALGLGATPSRSITPRLAVSASPPRIATSALAVPLYAMALRNDCEATALRMVLAARGVSTTDQAILARIGVDRAHPQFGRSGPLSGNPFRAFVGDPNGSEVAGTGFGVYHPPVAAAARSYGVGVLAAGQGVSVAQLQTQVTQGHPAIVWVDYLWRRMATTSYTAYDGTRVPYAGPAEHVVVVTGFSGGTVTINDPGRGRLSIPLSSFVGAYATYGNMAVIVS